VAASSNPATYQKSRLCPASPDFHTRLTLEEKAENRCSFMSSGMAGIHPKKLLIKNRSFSVGDCPDFAFLVDRRTWWKSLKAP